MTQPNPLAVPTAWNLVASDYAADTVPRFIPYAEDALRLAALAPRAKIIDVAAGPGTLACLAAKEGARVTAVDFSEAMIGKLRDRASKEGLSIDSQVADGARLPFAQGAFDAAFSMFGLMFFPDRARGFQELLRVLAPGRPAVVATWVSLERVPVMGFIFGAIQELLPGVPLGGSKAPLATPEQCSEEMTRAGFEDVVVHEVAHTTSYPSTAALWASASRNAPFALLRKKLGDEAWSRVEAGVHEKLVALFGSGPQEVTMPANLTFGRSST